MSWVRSMSWIQSMSRARSSSWARSMSLDLINVVDLINVMGLFNVTGLINVSGFNYCPGFDQCHGFDIPSGGIWNILLRGLNWVLGTGPGENKMIREFIKKNNVRNGMFKIKDRKCINGRRFYDKEVELILIIRESIYTKWRGHWCYTTCERRKILLLLMLI